MACAASSREILRNIWCDAMIEAILAVVIVCLAALCLSAGLLMGRGAPQRGCDGLVCVGGQRCHGCPHKHEEAA